MSASRRAPLLLIVTIGLLASGACGTKTIGHVLADPERYARRPVTIRGEVVQSYSVLGRGAYELRDHTGRLWILSTDGVPRYGSRVKVKGVVRDVFDLGPLIPASAGLGILMHESSRSSRQ